MALKRNSKLKHLDLRWNNIGVLGGRNLAAAMQHNKTIINLQIGGKRGRKQFTISLLYQGKVIIKSIKPIKNGRINFH